MQYLYLARRDKSAVELIGVYRNASPISSPTRVNSIHTLPISDKDKFELNNYYENKRHMWEIIVEDFANFADFRKRLAERRYQNIPSNADPKLFYEKTELLKLQSHKPKIMLQRKTGPDTFS